MKYVRILLMISISSFMSIPVFSETYDVTLDPGTIHNMSAYRMWIPPSVDKVRGILMLNPGSNSDGRAAVDDQYWRDFANKHDFALMGTYLTDHMHPNMMIEDYIQVSKGSGQAIIDAIDHFADESGQEELSYAPFLLWGMSAGGELNYELAAWIPDRIIAFVVNMGGYYYSSAPQEATRQTPGLFFVGLDDLPSRKTMVKGLFLTHRRAGALWTLAEEKGVGHEVIGSRDLAVIYFEEVMKKRLRLNAMGYKSLKAVSEDVGTVGDIYKHTLAPLEEGTMKEATAWLVSEKFAKAWQVFVTKERKN
jgi:pimeloyl-ACP methyl ester carboxylesterase